MQALGFLHNTLAHALPIVHARRLTALLAAVTALLHGKTLALSALGRALPTQAEPKHAIKRIDRLLGNTHLQTERPLFYYWLVRTLVSPGSQPVLLIDWSILSPGERYFLLRAALPIGGRAIPIYEKVYRKDGCPRAQQRLLDVLEKLLPEGCRPILVTDAGFRVPWFRAVQAKGWYYVGRVRHTTLYRASTPCEEHDVWSPVRSLYAKAQHRARALGKVELAQTNQFQTWLYLYRGQAKGRQNLTVTGRVARCARSLQSAAREREPWLLASNLPRPSGRAKRVIRLYRLRMQIEEGFRDLKNERYGFALHQQHCHQVKRLEILLLIAVLATYVLLLYGIAAQLAGLTRHYQSNTQARRGVLSLVFLGYEVWRREAILSHRAILPRQALKQALTGIIARAKQEFDNDDQ